VKQKLFILPIDAFSVTRLGEFSPIRRLFSVGSFFFSITISINCIPHFFELLSSMIKLILKRSFFGYILCDFFTYLSCHPECCVSNSYLGDNWSLKTHFVLLRVTFQRKEKTVKSRNTSNQQGDQIGRILGNCLLWAVFLNITKVA
jgi:hypothetical protein